MKPSKPAQQMSETGSPQKNDPIEGTVLWFSWIYLGGIPPTITDDSAFLSFISILTAIEALAGYRFSDVKSNGERFKRFVSQYFPVIYHPYADDLWKFRNSIVHAFTTSKKFALTHHHSEAHLKAQSEDIVILNAEDFYAALLWAAQEYFIQLRTDQALQRLMLDRLTSADGGGITVGVIEAPISSSGPCK